MLTVLQIGTVCCGESCATSTWRAASLSRIVLEPRCVSLELKSTQCDRHLTLAHITLAAPRGGYLQDSNDDPKQPYGTAKDLHNQDLDEEAGVLGISQGSPAAHDAHTDPAEEIA